MCNQGGERISVTLRNNHSSSVFLAAPLIYFLFDTRACHLGQKRKQRRKEKLHKQRMVCGQTNDVVETITGWADIDSTTHSSLISRHSHGCLSIFTRIFPYIPVFTRILPYSHVSSHTHTYLTISYHIHTYLTI